MVEKQKSSIQEMFTSISGTYDKINGVLSFGWYKRWYNAIIRKSKKVPHSVILDCATGTGNLAIKFKERFPDSKVTGVDFSEGMLELGREKIKEKQLDIQLINADILKLPFDDNSFDISAICFGIRNTESTVKCLTEMARVVKPGGQVYILEFGRPEGVMGILFSIYQRFFIPLIGKIISKDLKAYNYLKNSVIEYPYEYDFLEIMDESGCFKKSTFKRLSGGICYLYSGTVK